MLEDGNAVSRPNPQVPQGPGQSAGPPVELRVIQDPVALHQGRLVRVGPGGSAQQEGKIHELQWTGTVVPGRESLRSRSKAGRGFR